ncbi:MAG: hypothetical protein ACR2F6_03635 [Mycobacteriales bacterium]
MQPNGQNGGSQWGAPQRPGTSPPGGYASPGGWRVPTSQLGARYGPGPRRPIINPRELKPGRGWYVAAALLACAAVIGGFVGFGVNLAGKYGGDKIESGVAHLKKGADRGIYFEKTDDGSSCSLTGPDGIVPLDPNAKDDETGKKNGTTYYLRYTFTAPATGSYSLRCPGASGVTVLLGPPSAGKVFGSSGGAFALLGGIGGGGLAFAGLIAALVGAARQKDRRRRQEEKMRSSPSAYNWTGY